jgi:hypothetical protein
MSRHAMGDETVAPYFRPVLLILRRELLAGVDPEWGVSRFR